MPSTKKPKAKAAKSKDPGVKSKLNMKGQKIKKKRKYANKKAGRGIFSYTLLPKRKRLARKVITKLDNETDQYTIVRGLDAIKRLDHGKKILESAEEENYVPTEEELKWRGAKKTGTEYKKRRDNKVLHIMRRAMLRRKRIQAKREEELRRKKYRIHPNDAFHDYVKGYKKSRHRITKLRFMKCVDIPLFQDVLNDSKELRESPVWNEKLPFKTLSAEKANQLKDHLYQFDVIVECLKQGIFNKPGCDDFPFFMLRRKKKKDIQDEATPKPRRRKRQRHSSNSPRLSKLKRRLSFPPYETSKDDISKQTQKVGIIKGALKSMSEWLATAKHRGSNVSSLLKKKSSQGNKSQKEGDVQSSVSTLQQDVMDDEKIDEILRSTSVVSQTFRWARRTTLKSFLPMLRKQSMALSTGGYEGEPQDDDEPPPFADLLTIPVPNEPVRQKRFIRTLTDKKTKENPKRNSTKTAAEAAKQEEDEARQRHERVEKSDPLQRLHEDEKDSDICTVTDTTTTDGYASWRRPQDFRNAGNKQEILAHKVDTTFGWRVVLLLIVLWEIGAFVKTQLDDVYYGIFTSHLYRENIWLFEPTLFPTMEKYMVIHIQEWLHLIICGISISIIHRENECVSLLFAASLLFDGVIDIGISTHDYVYLPEPVDWICVALTALHVVWKVFIICLFIAYHYYCAGYIKKAREFKHRKTQLHNHEIKAKGTKGLQKRRMAWSWMTRHARDTNLRNLKQKNPTFKDGNLSEDLLAKDIKFCETKELRLYTQKHNLNIGYPYNKLHDMKRYVFEKLEKSDYTEQDDLEEQQVMRKKLNKYARRSSRAITLKKWQDWSKEKEEQNREINSHRVPSFRKSHKADLPSKTGKGNPNLTIDPTYSHHEYTRQFK